MDFTRAEAISIHAPLAGRDRLLVLEESLSNISIHAPLAGRDLFRHRQHCELQDFNPRAPRGARPLNSMGQQLKTLDFNPRAPRGARRNGAADRGRQCAISIHAPLAGRDQPRGTSTMALTNFNPRAPRGARQGCKLRQVLTDEISIHAPLAGRDNDAEAFQAAFDISIHAPLAGRDKGKIPLLGLWQNFNPRAPRGARQQMCTKITYIFALTHKRNTFSCQTPSVRALSKKLSGRFSHKIRCEPPCKTMCAAAPHYTISVPSGRYVCLQPKCSILLSYFFPK